MDLKKMYNDIPIGKDKAIEKTILSAIWNMPEREVRRKIQELRITDFGDYYVIISRSNGKGYYRSCNLKEIEEYKQEVLNRGRHTFLPLKKVNRILQTRI